MNKKYVICILFVAALLLLSFHPKKYEFTHEVSDWDTVHIEIVAINGSVYSTFHTVNSYSEAYIEENISIITVIEEKSEFIKELESIKNYLPLGTPLNTISGTAVRLIYPDGEIELITAYGSALISDSSVSVFTKNFDESEFSQLIEKWAQVLH